MGKLNGKTILITGASSGIGAAASRQLAQEGALVLMVARNREKLEKISGEIQQAGGKSKIYSSDISDIESVKKLATQVKAEVGIPDVLINNAGQGIWKFVEETEYEEVSQMMAVPYFGAFYLTKAFLPEMVKRRSGQIVNMTSYAGFIAFSGATAYIAARTAMVGFHNALRADLYGTGIKVSLAYFAKVTTGYWENNPGSEERLPGSSRLIPVISAERAARALVKGVIRKKGRITAPFMVYPMNVLVRHLPIVARLIMDKTGFRK